MGKLAIRTDGERVHYTQATAFSRLIEPLSFTERAAADAIQVPGNVVAGLGEARMAMLRSRSILKFNRPPQLHLVSWQRERSMRTAKSIVEQSIGC
jgi:hypothetical protein